MKDYLSQEIHGNMTFSVYMYISNVYMYNISRKNESYSSPEKIHLKMIHILDRILERVPTIVCTFMVTLIGVFIYCYLVKKQTNKRKQES